MSYVVKHLLFCMTIVSMIYDVCTQNVWDGDNKTFWRSTSNFNPITSTSYGLIQIGTSMHMEFSIIFHSRVSPGSFENIFRIGFSSENGNNCYSGSSRFPSLWIIPSSDKFLFSISDQDNCVRNYRQYLIEKETEYHIIIDYNQTWTSIGINNDIKIQSRTAETPQDIIGMYAHVWMSTDANSGSILAANVTMYDIMIESYGLPTESPTPIPTKQPTTNPTIYPTTTPITNNPSTNPSESPTNSPSDEPSMNPSISPTNSPTQHPSNYPSLSPIITTTNSTTSTVTSTATLQPSDSPALNPTIPPTKKPTTLLPTIEHTTMMTTNHPTHDPTQAPTKHPTYDPTLNTTFHTIITVIYSTSTTQSFSETTLLSTHDTATSAKSFELSNSDILGFTFISISICGLICVMTLIFREVCVNRKEHDRNQISKAMRLAHLVNIKDKQHSRSRRNTASRTFPPPQSHTSSPPVPNSPNRICESDDTVDNDGSPSLSIDNVMNTEDKHVVDKIALFIIDDDDERGQNYEE